MAMGFLYLISNFYICISQPVRRPQTFEHFDPLPSFRFAGSAHLTEIDHARGQSGCVSSCLDSYLNAEPRSGRSPASFLRDASGGYLLASVSTTTGSRASLRIRACRDHRRCPVFRFAL